MTFTFTEHEGDIPIYEWLIENVKEFAQRTYGIEVEIVIQLIVDQDGRRRVSWSLPEK